MENFNYGNLLVHTVAIGLIGIGFVTGAYVIWWLLGIIVETIFLFVVTRKK
jgi:hypothetical protein